MEIGARRDLTFTTLLGQVATTRVHHYRTYLDRRGAEDVDDLRDAAGQLLQAALADRARSRGSRARGEDWLTLEHTDPGTGAVRPGPHPDQPTLDELLDRGVDGDGDAGDE
ncbi:MAG: hypothetical protein DCC50_13040 [Acidobacteria bacterium]|nr:MAG: hypothetical protein DCC50_13040 [Acidobacteriota bacterium]